MSLTNSASMDLKKDTSMKSSIPKNKAKIDKMVNLYHSHHPMPNQSSSIMIQKINAPLTLVWSILRRFDQPQVYKKFLRKCTMLVGNGGIGSVREVEVISGMPANVSRERLDS